MGGCPPIWCAFTPGFIVWMMVLIDCTLKLIYFMLISVHSDRFHSPLQFFVSMKTAAFFSIALQFDRPELSNWPIGGLEIQFDKFGKIWCGRMKACDLLGWLTVHIFHSEWAKQFVELGRNFSPSTNSGERGTKELVKKGNILWFQGLKIEEKKFARRKSCLFSKGFFLFFFLIYFSSSFSLLSTPNRKYSNVC